MGIFRDINNRKKTEKQKHARRYKRQERAAIKAAKGPAHINIQDPELFSTDMLKKKLKNPRNNIKLSGKSRKKALKRLKNEMRDERKKAGDEGKEGDFVNDLFMEEADQVSETEAPAETPEMTEDVASSSKSSQPSSSGTATATKKKKRGGRKKKKGKGDAEDTGDVDMEEL